MKKTVLRLSLFGLAGAILGYTYYAFIGCNNGTCMITSNPMISSAYGALMGFLLGGSFPGAARNSEEREAKSE